MKTSLLIALALTTAAIPTPAQQNPSTMLKVRSVDPRF